ncbi:MAG: hypothetical protein LBT11_00065, partial [Treponema sp.]|nr:hypothetical protein [Treponema sp.]
MYSPWKPAPKYLHYTPEGYLFILPEDNLDWTVEAMLATGYNEEFCLALDFSPAFVARLIAAGFLVMSTRLGAPAKGPEYLLLPKLHVERSVLFWEDLRVTKTAERRCKRYELRFDTDFDTILDRCVAVHGSGWLTPPLLESLRNIRLNDPSETAQPRLSDPSGTVQTRLASFGLYRRDGSLAAGEFGSIVKGPGNPGIYTSYSGYTDEDSAGTVQMALTGRWLRD